MTSVRSLFRGVLPTLLGLLTTLAVGQTQCGVDWQAGDGAPGPIGSVLTSLRLPNGDLLVGGAFATAGNVAARNVARFDGSAWSAVGGGVSGPVRSMLTLPNGDLLVGGNFSHAGGVAAPGVARFDGSSWTGFGNGLAGDVRTIHVLPNGDLLAGGSFVTSGGLTIPGLARWDGSSWVQFGPGLSTGYVTSIVDMPNGDLVIGGYFYIQNGATFIRHLVRFDGTNWSEVPGLGPNSLVNAIRTLPLGQFAICGLAEIGGVQARVAQFDGTAMVALGAPTANYESLAVDAQGRLLAGGADQTTGEGRINRFDGVQWTTLPAGAPRSVRTMLPEPNGALTVGGGASGGVPFRTGSVRRFDGSAWQDFGPAAPHVYAMATLPNGDLVVGGDFTSIGGVAANHVARWDGTTYHAMGGGFDGIVHCLDVSQNGLLVAGGEWPGVANGRVAVWNGAAWSNVGTGLDVLPTQIAINDLNQVMVVSFTALRLFDGAGWSTPPTLGPIAYQVVADENDEFVFAGIFTGLGGPLAGVARYTGGTYVPEPNGIAHGTSIIRKRDGSLVVAGVSGVTLTSQLQRFAGGVWTTLPDAAAGMVRLAELPDRTLIGIAPGNPRQVQRLSGPTPEPWGAIDMLTSQATVFALATTPRGEVFVGGPSGIVAVDGVPSAGFVRAVPDCPASASVVGSGCFGGAGPVTLAAVDLPWLGAALRSRATGMALPSIGLHLAGLDPLALPLPLPMAAPGCTLQVDPVVIDAFLPQATQVEVGFAVPAVTALIGQQLRTQVVGLELDALGAITRTTASNALQLTVGTF